ncbi:MAG: acyl-CoA synthetase [Deltaproteobacteria bacterium]|nr:acyl-CoA synthetase [Deltaproteobacteria bacterium]
MRTYEHYNIVTDCLDKHASDTSKMALLFVDEALSVHFFTFCELAESSRRFSAGLVHHGFKAGDRLVLRFPNGPKFPVAFLGAARIGVILIPSSPLLTEGELDFLVQDSEAKGVVTPENFSEFAGDESSKFEMMPVSKSGPAFWLYTSGTEGQPKAVIHAHRSIPAHDERVRLWQDLKSDDVVFNTSSLNWSYALTCGLLDVWRHGAAVAVYSGEITPEKIGRVIQECGVTVFMSVPGIYRKLAGYFREGAMPLQGVRVCLSAGEKLPGEVRHDFKKAVGLEIYEGLGMTEHSVYLVQRYGEPIVEGSCGRPLPGSRIAILREDLSECEPDEIGILASHRSCEGLMIGYHQTKSPPAPLCKGGKGGILEGPGFYGEWFLSGDLAYRDVGGNFFFVGRRDDVITAGGYRISPMEVEAVLNRHPAVLESAVIEREIEPGKTIVVAHVVGREAPACRSGRVSAPELIAHAAQHLAKYKLPREVVFVDSLPKTRNGKIRRKELLSKINP